MVDKTSSEAVHDPAVSDRRRQLIAAAHALIAEKGFEGLRVREVAARVGVNNATLHYYFPTKEALISAVVAAIVAELERVAAPRRDPAVAAPRAALRAHFESVIVHMGQHPELFVVLYELYLRAGRDDEVRRLLVATDASWHGHLLPLLEAGVACGEFRNDLDPEAAAAIITSFFKGFGMQLNLTLKERRAALEELLRWLVGESSDAEKNSLG